MMVISSAMVEFLGISARLLLRPYVAQLKITLEFSFLFAEK